MFVREPFVIMSHPSFRGQCHDEYQRWPAADHRRRERHWPVTRKGTGQGRRRLVMPRFIYTGRPSRLLPVDWFDALTAFFGITRSMDEFRGRR